MTFNELTLISSRHNLRFKEWNRLNTAQGVKKHGLLIIEGLRACLTAMEHQAEIKTVLLSDDPTGEHIFNNISSALSQGRFEHDQFFRLDPELFDSIADSKQPQGIIFLIKKPELFELAEWLEFRRLDIEDKAKPIRLALLDQLNDPGNVGTIIRTANAFNFSGIILSSGTVDPYNPKLMRSTMGSLFALDLIKLERYSDLDYLANKYKLPIYISDMNGKLLSDFELPQRKANFILGIGNEARGVNRELLDTADEILTIPMPGQTESLNAAIAFSIIAYNLSVD